MSYGDFALPILALLIRFRRTLIFVPGKDVKLEDNNKPAPPSK
jgi:hypothetical protein